MAIERDGTLTFSARFIHHFVMTCRNLEEARKSLPDLTAEQFEALRNGEAQLVGDSKAGLEIVERETNASSDNG